MTRMMSVSKAIHSVSVIQVYALTTNAKKDEVEWFYGDLQYLLEHQKISPFHRRGLEWKSRKLRDTWKQVWPWSTKWSRAMSNRVLPREHTAHSKKPLSRTQQMTLCMDITRWSILKSDWLYSLHPKMEKLYTVSKNKTSSWLWPTSWTYCQIQTWVEESRENH